MTYSLAVTKEGRLDQQGSKLGVVWGTDKLYQDLSLWVRQRYRGDRFHPDMGSILQDMIGGTIDVNTRYLVQNEVARVLDNYQRVQYNVFRKAPSKFSASELLFSIDSIAVQVLYDRITATVKVHSAGGDETSLNIKQGF